jgi:hypothetical protein
MIPWSLQDPGDVLRIKLHAAIIARKGGKGENAPHEAHVAAGLDGSDMGDRCA